MLYWRIYEVPGFGAFASRTVDPSDRAVCGVGLRPLAAAIVGSNLIAGV
jgi:hypothetical protein